MNRIIFFYENFMVFLMYLSDKTKQTISWKNLCFSLKTIHLNSNIWYYFRISYLFIFFFIKRKLLWDFTILNNDGPYRKFVRSKLLRYFHKLAFSFVKLLQILKIIIQPITNIRTLYTFKKNVFLKWIIMIVTRSVPK